MYAPEPEVTLWMESRGYSASKSLNKVSYFKDNGRIRSHVNFNQAASEFCYSRSEYRHGTEGQILNELGKIAKVKDIILRAENGYVLVRMGEKGPAVISREEVEESDGIKRKRMTKHKIKKEIKNVD
jgi:rRNA processing protein Gar1